MDTPATPRRRTTRARIIRAAAGLTRQQGFERTSLEQVARRAGIDPIALYRHFPDKRTLLIELFDHWVQHLVPQQPGTETTLVLYELADMLCRSPLEDG
jgi:AcrR family transcriptional regulator